MANAWRLRKSSKSSVQVEESNAEKERMHVIHGERRALEDVFSLVIDVNRDGYISLEEIKQIFGGRTPRGLLTYFQQNVKNLKEISYASWEAAYTQSSKLEKWMMLRLTLRISQCIRKESDEYFLSEIAVQRRSMGLIDAPDCVHESNVLDTTNTNGAAVIPLHRRESTKRENEIITIPLKKATQVQKPKMTYAEHCRRILLLIKHQMTSVISYTSPMRLSWDILMALLLVYISITTPLLYAFGDQDAGVCYGGGSWAKVDVFIDVCFMIDILLNFSTSYADQRGNEVTSRRRILINYLQTWFLLDVVSTIPLDCITTGMPLSLQPAKLLKLSKITKVFRMVRISKVIRLAHGSLSESFEDFFVQSSVQSLLKVVNILFASAVICHWLACLMAISGPGFLREYEQDENDFDEYSFDFETGSVLRNDSGRTAADWHKARQYLAALYWSITTLTTVGSGDILPHSDSERAATMVAMIFGASFYGFVIAEMSSIVLTRDVKTRRFLEKMDTIKAWLEHHELPQSMRDRVLKYVRAYYRQRTALDEYAILDDMSPDLREELTPYLIPREIASHPIFDSLPAGTIAHLAPIIVTVKKLAREIVVRECDPGVGMYVITSGQAIMFSHADQLDANATVHDLHVGDSFGELALLGVETSYHYTVEATTDLELHAIPAEHFLKCFKGMADILSRIKVNLAADIEKKNLSESSTSTTLNASSQLGHNDNQPGLELIQSALEASIPQIAGALYNRLNNNKDSSSSEEFITAKNTNPHPSLFSRSCSVFDNNEEDQQASSLSAGAGDGTDTLGNALENFYLGGMGSSNQPGVFSSSRRRSSMSSLPAQYQL